MTPAERSFSRSPRVTLTIVVSRKVRNRTARTVARALRREAADTSPAWPVGLTWAMR
jgi:hypothetical protein